VSEQIIQPRLGAVGWLRWTWRQLTSMRTALLLLLALAVAAVPGSVFPQRAIDASRTADWIAKHETTGPLLDRLGFFEVYASPWFAAIYLLLFVSLVGCVLPRSLAHWRAMRGLPPRTPARLERLPAFASASVELDPDAALEATRRALRGKRMRVHSHAPGTLSAEGGYLKELGNLAFHLALIGVIVGVAVGHLLGWKGDVILPEGQTFVNTPLRYDTPINAGPWVDTSGLQPFSIRVDRFDADFEAQVKGKGQFGQPRDFTAHVTYTPEPGATPETTEIKVNGPLEARGATAFLLGNGYAPRITVRDAAGQVLYTGTTVFLAQDNNYTSTGAIKVPAATPKELGFAGIFMPTADVSPTEGMRSIFPQAVKPALALTLFEGDLAPGGRAQSVFVLDTEAMTQVRTSDGQPLRIWLEPGQTVQLPGGRGSITFDGVSRWAGLSIRHDPGKWLTLVSALLALGGLIGSLLVHRRRVFVRVGPSPDGTSTLVSVGGLAKDDDDRLADVVADVLAAATGARTTPPKA
jgi:cytochrome c biogenesis protein